MKERERKRLEPALNKDDAAKAPAASLGALLLTATFYLLVAAGNLVDADPLPAQGGPDQP
jgi:hypothetical protein